ncbi:hypothetical protein A4L73_27955 [Salmonella enterica subsp. enterica serovar Enteritidis]|nr:hypothetical protein [Salmonella enterica subsp. enterica serovar Enteritidis]
MNLGSARDSHVLRVRSCHCALSVFKLAAPPTVSAVGYCYGVQFACNLAVSPTISAVGYCYGV